MFSKGSRYRNLPESTVLTARGERLRGKELRAISRLPGQFQHIVRDGDRLDLLAFKYYGDPARWWQIADANSEFEFPVDMLDRLPVVKERLVLRHQEFLLRFDALRVALEEFGEVRATESSSFEGATSPQEPDFIDSAIVVIYQPSPATRQRIIGEINQRLHFIASFAWTQDSLAAEAFRLDDPVAKSQWQVMTATLLSKPGVLEVTPAITQSTLGIAYNRSRISRPEILGIIAANGFSIRGEQSTELLRAGSRIVVPPNAIL